VLARLRQKGLELDELREVVSREIDSLPAEPEEVS
jgi:hypothetical protein